MYVRKEDFGHVCNFDAWIPQLSPSPRLLDWLDRNAEEVGAWQRFVDRYEREMIRDRNNRKLILMLGALVRRAPLSIGCYCKGTHCHRFVLERLIRSAAAGRMPL